jgi:protein MpaA
VRVRRTRLPKSLVDDADMLLVDAAPPPPPLVARAEVIGRSVRGRPIRLLERGSPENERVVLVVGCIHGDECSGLAVTRRLARARSPRRFHLWIVPVLNPDGHAARTRQNARGVDLNRNFPARWRAAGRRWDPEYPGPRPLSEPETRVARRVVLRLRPDVTIWYHQPQRVVRAWGRSRRAARRYARAAHASYRSILWPNGSGPRWQNTRFERGVSFVVELRPGRLPPAAARRHARAVRALGVG